MIHALKKKPNMPLYAHATLREAILLLQKAHINSASLDARILLQYVMGITREKLLENQMLEISAVHRAQFMELAEKRAKHQPIAQLIAKREFWSLTFKVTADTLDPRADSETLIEAALSHYRNHTKPSTILDFGTGTGCLLLTLLHNFPDATGTGVDISEAALDVARENAKNLHLSDRCQFEHASWGETSKEGRALKESYDVIISNPPYIPTCAIKQLAPEVAEYEPMLALDGGEDGLKCYRDLMPYIKEHLAKDGLALLEIGAGQTHDVSSIAQSQGLRVLGTRDDMACITRCIMLTHEIYANNVNVKH